VATPAALAASRKGAERAVERALAKRYLLDGDATCKASKSKRSYSCVWQAQLTDYETKRHCDQAGTAKANVRRKRYLVRITRGPRICNQAP
jgi:hypothetical protein